MKISTGTLALSLLGILTTPAFGETSAFDIDCSTKRASTVDTIRAAGSVTVTDGQGGATFTIDIFGTAYKANVDLKIGQHDVGNLWVASFFKEGGEQDALSTVSTPLHLDGLDKIEFSHRVDELSDVISVSCALKPKHD